MPCLRAAVAALLSCCLLGATALAQNKAVKIGVLDDMSGPYAENTGPGDVAAARFAIADFGGSVLGKPIELVSADFQSKVDVGVSIAKRLWDDENVDVVIGIIRDLKGYAASTLVNESSQLFADLAIESIDLVMLNELVERHYSRQFPFADFMAELGRLDQRDVSIGQFANFIRLQLEADGSVHP